jgi:hypothetical protein
MSYFTVLCITATVENGEVYNDVLFKTVGSYRNSIEFFSQLCERHGVIQVDPMTTAQKKQIMNGDYDVVALLVDPDVFYACRELNDGAEFLCRKAIARIDVTKYVKAAIEELWPIKKTEPEVVVTAKKGAKKK